MIIFILVFIGLFAISILINVFQFNSNKKLKSIAEEQNREIERCNKNVDLIIKYQKIISEIRNKESKIHNQIKEARTDEEVNDIIRNILNDNNISMLNS